MEFYLGTHIIAHVKRTDVPLMISVRQTRRLKKLYRSKAPLFIDSGAFSELSLYGKWKTTIEEYIDEIEYINESMGNIRYISPMDYMCEPFIVKKTGLSVSEHQKRTVDNYISLIKRTRLPIIPVLQGYTLEEYINCYKMYLASGINLFSGLVGLGSVCRRQSTDEIFTIVNYFYNKGIKLHGFGVKIKGLSKYGHQLYSADSMAWSFEARYLPAQYGHTHLNCANCLEYALDWRDRVLLNTR